MIKKFSLQKSLLIIKLPDIIKKDLEQHRAVQENIAQLIQNKDEINGVVQHQGFTILDKSQKKTVVEACPEPEETTSRDGKSKYNKKLAISATLRSLIPVDGICTVNEDGSYSVTAKINIMKRENEPTFEDWCKENYEKVWDDEDTLYTNFWRSYVDSNGELAGKTTVRLSNTTPVTIKYRDDGESSIFRQTFEGTKVLKITTGSLLNVTNVTVNVWIYMAKEPELDGAYMPRYSISLMPKNISPCQNFFQARAATMRETENGDAHFLKPIMAIHKGEARVEPKSYIFARHNYSTPEPVDGPGVTYVFKDAVMDDYIFGNSEKAKITWGKTITVYNWHNSIADGYDKYLLTLQTDKTTSGPVSRSFGILDPKSYGPIMLAHHDIPFHANISFWSKRTLYQTAGNDPATIAQDTTGTKGYYTYGVTDMVPDFKYYFEDCKGAIQISLDLCKTLFKKQLAKSMEDDSLQMNMEPRLKDNPVNRTATLGDIIVLGHPDDLAFSGDAWPLVSNGAIYVMTSHKLDYEERQTICGIAADTKTSDARFKELLQKEENFKYYVYVVTNPTKMMDTNEDEVEEPQKRIKTPKSTSSKKKTKK